MRNKCDISARVLTWRNGQNNRITIDFCVVVWDNGSCLPYTTSADHLLRAQAHAAVGWSFIALGA